MCGLPYGVHNYKLRPPQSQGFRREEIKHAHATMFRLYNRKTQQRNTYARAAQRGEGAAAIPLSGALPQHALAHGKLLRLVRWALSEPGEP